MSAFIIAFLPYLESQLEAIQPKLVATLGRHSLNCFLPDLSISQVHGEPKRMKMRLSKEKRVMSSELAEGQDADGMQGAGEARTEPYKPYGKGALEPATQQTAAKLGSASGSARRQDELVLVILPLFHPAAALYNGGMRQTLIDDFAKIPAILKKI